MTNNMDDSNEWNKAVKKHFGFDASHLSISHGLWIIESWDKKQYPELAINDDQLLNKIDKLHTELVAKKRNEGPLTQELISGKMHFLTKKSIGKCILTNVGMNEMAKRSTDNTSTTNTHHAIGTGTTTETVGDTSLQTQVGIKVIGTRDVVNQTERYGTSFTGGDISPPKNITEAGIFTAISGGILIMRITTTPVNLDIGKIITIQTNVTHQNGIEI